MTRMILAGDVGGTKTNLGLFRFDSRAKAGRRLASVREQTFSSQGFPSSG